MILEADKIKFKEITPDERAVYLRRLLRFKYPPDKRLRVYRQILTTHSIEPRISNKIFDTLLPAERDFLVSKIWNFAQSGDFALSERLLADDIRCFSCKKMVEDFLGAKVDGECVPDILSKTLENSGYTDFGQISSFEEAYSFIFSRYPLEMVLSDVLSVKKLLLVEGATEEILLPHFAGLLGLDLARDGVLLVASGGKNQVVKDYLFHKENLRLEIVVVLDSDAKEQQESINSVRRAQDSIFLLEEGEFEDLLPLSLILKALNMEFKNMASFAPEDFDGEDPMTRKLHELFKIKGVGEFKKVEFAKMILKAAEAAEEIGEKFKSLIFAII